MKPLSTALAAALLLTVFSTAHASDAQLNAVLERESPKFMHFMPTQGALADAPLADMGGAYANRAERYDPASYAAERAQARRFGKALLSIPSGALSGKGRDIRDMAAGIVEGIEGVPGIEWGAPDLWFGHLPFAVNQISGPAINIPEAMETQQKVESLADANDYIQKISDLGPSIASAEEKMKADAALGVYLPAALYKGTISYLEGFIAPKPQNHPLVRTFAEKLGKIENLAAPEKDKLIEAAARGVEKSVYPAYRSLLTSTKQLSKTPARGDGIWAQPDGDKYYAWIAAYHGDTAMTPDQIHATGLAEVGRITGEMDKILKSIGLTEGTVGARMQKLALDPSDNFANSDAGRAELLAYLNGAVASIMRKAPEWFEHVPQQQVEVRRVPAETENGAPGGSYTNPSLDGKTPGIFWINLKNMDDNPKHGLKSLTFHEAVPGHHFQSVINMANTGLPFLLRIGVGFNAYSEGWALYAENLAADMKMYEGDPEGDLGRLQSELFRAVRLVVDTGLHAKRWSREKAIAYMVETTGNNEEGVTREIERYMAWPGQALGYKLGMLKILALREKAKAALGPKFDIRKFHTVVLEDGSEPLSVLERHVDAWIEREQSR